MMTRAEVLRRAEACVNGSREQDYGSPEQGFQMIAALWDVYLVSAGYLVADGYNIRPHDVAAMLALLKIARIASGHAKDDNWIDLAGYAACGGELESGGIQDSMEGYGL